MRASEKVPFNLSLEEEEVEEAEVDDEEEEEEEDEDLDFNAFGDVVGEPEGAGEAAEDLDGLLQLLSLSLLDLFVFGESD